MKVCEKSWDTEGNSKVSHLNASWKEKEKMDVFYKCLFF